MASRSRRPKVRPRQTVERIGPEQPTRIVAPVFAPAGSEGESALTSVDQGLSSVPRFPSLDGGTGNRYGKAVPGTGGNRSGTGNRLMIRLPDRECLSSAESL